MTCDWQIVWDEYGYSAAYPCKSIVLEKAPKEDEIELEEFSKLHEGKACFNCGEVVRFEYINH